MLLVYTDLIPYYTVLTLYYTDLIPYYTVLIPYYTVLIPYYTVFFTSQKSILWVISWHHIWSQNSDTVELNRHQVVAELEAD